MPPARPPARYVAVKRARPILGEYSFAGSIKPLLNECNAYILTAMWRPPT